MRVCIVDESRDPHLESIKDKAAHCSLLIDLTSNSYSRTHFLFESHFYDHFFFASLFHVFVCYFFLEGSTNIHSISTSLWLSSMAFKKHTFIATEIGYFHWNLTVTSLVYRNQKIDMNEKKTRMFQSFNTNRQHLNCIKFIGMLLILSLNKWNTFFCRLIRATENCS